MTQTIKVGQPLSSITLKSLKGGTLELSKPTAPFEWKLIVVYRGKHCPVCTTYLKTLNELTPEFHAEGIEVVAISGDSEERARVHLSDIEPAFEVGYDLSLEEMNQLGLYVSDARLGMNAERPFSEPAILVINDENNLQMVDVSNVPWGRPNLQKVLGGLRWLKKQSPRFPVTGTYAL